MIAEKNVRRRDVAVNQLGRVDVSEGLEQLDKGAEAGADPRGTLGNTRGAGMRMSTDWTMLEIRPSARQRCGFGA